MKTRVLILQLAVSLCLAVLMAGCTDSAGSPVTPDVNPSQSSLHLQDSQSASAYRGSPGTTLTTVPIDTAYNRTLAAFWIFALEGPYSANPNWSAAVLDPVPVTLYDLNGTSLYYEFYLRNADGIPGYFWTPADKRVGSGIFRIYEGAPNADYARIARDAENIVNNSYPGYPVLSEKPGLYGGGYPYLCTIVTVLNTTSEIPETIVVDAYTLKVVPDHPSEEYPGPEYARSYLDAIPDEEQTARIARWEADNSNATKIVAYALAHGIDPRLPLSVQNTSIIRDYYAAQLSDPAIASNDTLEQPDERPLTDDIIVRNIVSVDTARDQAAAKLWRIVLDRPDNFAERSWDNASLSKNESLIIQDINGNKLYYVFSVERGGKPVSEIIVDANKGLYSHRLGLETAASEYDFANATKKARDIAEQEFPGGAIQNVRPVYSLADNCCHNVTMMLDVENPKTREMNHILVDTYTIETSFGTVSDNPDVNAASSLFSVVTRQEYANNINLWEENALRDQNFVNYAASLGITADRPLNDTDIVALGAYVFRTEPRDPPLDDLYNPLYPQPAAQPVPVKEIQAWHEQAYWFSVILIDASLTDEEIEKIVASHRIAGNYTLDILTGSVWGTAYYLNVPTTAYNSTFSTLEKDGSVWISEPVSSNREYLNLVKIRNGSVIVPLVITYPVDANARRLAAEGIPIKAMKVVYIRYDEDRMKKADRENLLAELDADDRILFAFREY